MALRKYNKKLNYSYTLGVYPTIELIKQRPKEIIKIILNPKSDNNAGVKEIKQECEKKGIKYEYSIKNISKISVKENTYAAGLFNKYRTELSANTDHVVLVNPSDPGNMGTIIRTMLGFGIKDLAIIRPGVDIFDPKTIRASMGSFFNVNFEYFDSFKQYTSKYPKNKLYSFMLNGNKTLEETTFESPFTLIFGPENSGLDDSFRKIGDSVTIEHDEAIDSLNLSMAVGIALYRSRHRK